MNYILDFSGSVSEIEINNFISENNITILKTFDALGRVYLVSSDQHVEADGIVLLSAILDNPEGIQLLDTITITLDPQETTKSFNIEDDKNWWKVASIDNIDFDNEIHEHVVRGAESVVYVVDSGLDVTHPEFINTEVELLFSFNNDFIDYNGHGTALSSLIAGESCAVSKPKIKVVKIFQNDTPTLQSDIIGALNSILNDYLNNNRPASIVNASWSIPYNEIINSKFQQLIDAGIFVVAASGNSGMPINDVTPACIPDVLTIGSFNQDLAPSSFSNYTGGSEISYTADDVNYGVLDGWAPGEMIWAANKDGGYGYIAGTSAAAAIASAAAAYNLSRYISADGTVCDFSDSNNQLTLYSFLTVWRDGILNLDDARYTNSVNRIVTFQANPIPTPLNYIFRGKSGTTLLRPMVSIMDAISFSYNSANLPTFMSLDKKGILKSVIPEILEGTYEIFEPIVLTVQYKDYSTRDTTIFFSINNNYAIQPEDAEEEVEINGVVVPITLAALISGDRCDAFGNDCFPDQDCASFCRFDQVGKDTQCNCATG